MDEDKKERRDNDMYTDSKVKYEIERIAYRNMLWILYRTLSEDIITTEELEKIGYKIM